MRRATSVPMWSRTVRPRGGSLHPSMPGTSTRWPLEETGRNSVSPWTRPRMISCTGARYSLRQRPDGLGASAGALFGNRGDDVEEQGADALQVRLEEPEHLGLGHRLHAADALDAGVVVGDEGDGGVTHAELPGQVGLGVLGHVDDVEALAAVPAGLGPAREAGPLDDDHRARRVDGDAR